MTYKQALEACRDLNEFLNGQALLQKAIQPTNVAIEVGDLVRYRGSGGPPAGLVGVVRQHHPFASCPYGVQFSPFPGSHNLVVFPTYQESGAGGWWCGAADLEVFPRISVG